MSEPISLEMSPKPGDKSVKKRWPLPPAFLLLLVLSVLAIVALAWVALGHVQSVSAELDSMPYTVEAPLAGRVLSISVKGEEKVERGQLLAMLGQEPAGNSSHGARDQSNLEPASNQPALKRGERMIWLQEAEKNLNSKLETARTEEEATRKQRDESVLEHVKAQLAMRGHIQRPRSGKALGVNPGLEETEAQARTRMVAAKDSFEHASLQRAAIEREYEKIHFELTALKRAAPGASAGWAPSKMAESRITAPIAGFVTKIAVTVGQSVASGQHLFILKPDRQEDKPQWVMAWFSTEDAKDIHPGHPCVIDVPGMGNFPGRVREVLPPVDQAGTKGSNKKLVPVRISFNAPPPGSIALGAKLRCEVKTRSLFGFSGF